MQLAEIDSDVTNLIVRKPLEGTMLFREVVQQLLVTRGLLPDNSDSGQLAVSLRVQAATLPDLRWAVSAQSGYSGLVRLRGVVLGITATVSYTKSTKYTCPREDCEGHHGNQYVRIHVPGASEQDTVGRKFRCCVCGTKLREVKSQRSLSDKLLAEILPVRSLGDTDVHTGQRHQTVGVVIRDDLCSRVQLGQRYDVIGTQRVHLQADNVTSVFEVNNLLPVKERCSTGSLAGCLTLHVQQLFSRWNNTPSVLPHLMALHLAGCVCPPNCFFKLKLLLLISLVLTSEVPPLHVLAVCSETNLVQRLMDYVARLVARAVTHTSLHVLGANVTASPYPWAPYFLHAGSLVLSCGGVCKVGDLRAMKKSCRLELQTALNESQVQVALEARYTGGLPRVMSLPLSCQVWALLSTTTAAANHASWTYGASATATDMAPALLDAFSIMCYCDVILSSSTDITEDLVTHLLTSNMAPREGSASRTPRSSSAKMNPAVTEPVDSLSLEDFKQYVQAARNQRSVMTVEAEWLLTSYLISARQARARASVPPHGAAVPLSAWNTLQALAHGLCRLGLRTAVVESDAVMAVMMYEETLTARHGVSALNVFPEPHLPSGSAETYVTTQLGHEMQKFHSRLLSFCANTGVNPSNEE